jgi:hypothetical protein
MNEPSSANSIPLSLSSSLGTSFPRLKSSFGGRPLTRRLGARRGRPFFYAICPFHEGVTLGKGFSAHDSLPESPGVFDDLTIRERGLEDYRLEFVYVSRNVEEFGTACFGNGEIHLMAFESDHRFRIFGCDCFGLVKCFTEFSIPAIWDSISVESSSGKPHLSVFEAEPKGDDEQASASDVGCDPGLGSVVADEPERAREGDIAVHSLIFAKLSWANCVSLFWICIPNCLAVLCSRCFFSCAVLRDVTFESASQLQRMESEVFASCLSLSRFVSQNVSKLFAGDVFRNVDLFLKWHLNFVRTCK